MYILVGCFPGRLLLPFERWCFWFLGGTKLTLLGRGVTPDCRLPLQFEDWVTQAVSDLGTVKYPAGCVGLIFVRHTLLRFLAMIAIRMVL